MNFLRKSSALQFKPNASNTGSPDEGIQRPSTPQNAVVPEATTGENGKTPTEAAPETVTCPQIVTSEMRQIDTERSAKIHVNGLINEKLNAMPIRVIDTWFGTFCDRSQIYYNFTHSDEYLDANGDVQKIAQLVQGYFDFAMLSHRWELGEPLFRHVDKALRDEDVASIYMMQTPPGVKKLQQFCGTAAKCGYRWAWSDTCCIDKSSSAETQESINSMFQWYRNSAITVVYLAGLEDSKLEKDSRRPAAQTSSPPSADTDVLPPYNHKIPSQPLFDPSSDYPPFDNPVTLEIVRSRDSARDWPCFQPDDQVKEVALTQFLATYLALDEWFKRGWTLQELLAPRNIRFYTKEWKSLEKQGAEIRSARQRMTIDTGNQKQDKLWLSALTNASGIPRNDLVSLEAGCRDVRPKLHWASDRVTTRVEDIAYCLMGIFDISMPILYGEGAVAFMRLQEEIMKRTYDIHIFDWSGAASTLNSCLASHPRCFIEEEPAGTSSEEKTVGFLNALGGATDIFTSAIPGFAFDRITKMFKDPPPGHSLTSGEMTMSLFEYRVTKITEVTAGDQASGKCWHYKIKAKGLDDLDVITHQKLNEKDPTCYYVGRMWDRNIGRVFQTIFSSFSSNILKKSPNETLTKAYQAVSSHISLPSNSPINPPTLSTLPLSITTSSLSTLPLSLTTSTMKKSIQPSPSNDMEKPLRVEIENSQREETAETDKTAQGGENSVESAMEEQSKQKLTMGFFSSFYKPFVAQLVYKNPKTKSRKRIATTERIKASYEPGNWDFGLTTKLRHVC
ncbi:heterokaryon incompatibility protein-domain-containing protein [Hygrophoropsis aurantiaca]|uniref:Heterokaryon incompatibility protein-domain-containing protein n=1 Tax=Hygrophoropsis aurantiaca TaxID=72124 RepID=A0ACB7ZZ81_9AGAM|nr:heterokaryon incompatibility protein-domain-containing protein [Hygrophoropsis aurantiaca]